MSADSLFTEGLSSDDAAARLRRYGANDILLLGTNDLGPIFETSAEDVARNVGKLVTAVQQTSCGPGGQPPGILLLSPPHLGPLTGFGGQRKVMEEKSRQLAGHYHAAAERASGHFLDAAGVVTSSPIDGVHWDAEQHARLAARVADLVRHLPGIERLP